MLCEIFFKAQIKLICPEGAQKKPPQIEFSKNGITLIPHRSLFGSAEDFARYSVMDIRTMTQHILVKYFHRSSVKSSSVLRPCRISSDSRYC